MNIYTGFFAAFSIGLFIIAAFLDIQSTQRNNGVPGLYEKNALFRERDGTANISKLIVVNIVVFIAAALLTAFLYAETDAGIFAFLPFFVWAVIRVPVVMSNRKKYRQYIQKQL